MVRKSEGYRLKVVCKPLQAVVPAPALDWMRQKLPLYVETLLYSPTGIVLPR